MSKAATRRTMISGTIATVATGALLRPSAALAADAPYVLPMSMVHPELREMAKGVQAAFGKVSTMTREGIVAARKSSFQGLMAPQPPSDVPVEKKMIPVGKGHPDVAIYVINAKPGASRPAILETHGGGYILGTAAQSVRGLQDMAKELDCAIVAVDYRLAPETTYLGSIEDNYAGLKWLHTHAEALGVDRSRIAVYGGSAGGGHAAMLAIVARDRGEVPVCFQCLVYPMLDDRTGSSVQKPPHAGAIMWSPASNRLGWECFLGQKPGLRKAPVMAVPARNPNLKGLPPTFIGVGTLDLFCDEDIDYGQRLSAAGVLCETIVVPGAFHGFDMLSKMSNSPLGTWFEKTKMNALRRGFGMAAV